MHHLYDIISLQKIARLEDNAVCSCCEHLNPKAFIKNFASKDKDFHVGIACPELSADIYANGCAATQSKVEQNEVGLAFSHQLPKIGFACCCANNLCLRHFGLQDLLSTLKFQFVVLDNDYFEFIHIV